MPRWISRRYTRPTNRIGRTEKVVGVGAALLALGIVIGFVADVARDRHGLFEVDESAYAPLAVGVTGPEEEPAVPGGVVVPSPFPAVDLDGWRCPEQGSRYTPENLFLKIDGAAPDYVRSGVASLTFATYVQTSDPKTTVDVYWYDFGKPENASRVYRAEATPGAERVDLGDSGYRVGGAVFFRTGRHYVQLLPSDDREVSREATERIARRIHAWLAAGPPTSGLQRRGAARGGGSRGGS